MDNNARLMEHGLFWRRENEQRKLWGTLRVNEHNEAELETFGSLIDYGEHGKHTIFGQIRAGQEWVTLIDCISTTTQNLQGSRGRETDWSHQTCHVNWFVRGIGFDEGEEIGFDVAAIHASTLPKWVKPNQVKLDKVDGGVVSELTRVTVERLPDKAVQTFFKGQQLRITLKFSPRVGGDFRRGITSYSVEDYCYLDIEDSDSGRIPLEKILSAVKAMQDLLSICCNEPAIVTSIPVLFDKSDPSRAEVYGGFWGSSGEGEEGNPFTALGFEGLGGMDGIARWIGVAEQYGIAVALLTSSWYRRNTYNEDKFLRMYTAVEGLNSKKNRRKEAKLRGGELEEFVEQNIPSFSAFTYQQPKEWAKRAQDLRNQRIGHLDPSSGLAYDGRTLHVMANVLYVAGASFLLKEAGVSGDQIQTYLQGTQRRLLLKE